MKPKDIFVARPQQQNTLPNISEHNKTQKLIAKLHQSLIAAHSFFPFQLFPDELIINPIEIVYINNIFFWTSFRTSMLIEEIGDVELVEGPIFASLTITSTSTLKDEPIHMTYLTKKNARKAHALLQGLVTIQKENIDLENVLQEKKGIEEIIAIGTVKE